MHRLFWELLLIGLFYAIGNFMVELFNLPFPGSIVGMLLLFSSLAAGVCKLTWVEKAANLHLKHIVLFFIPPTVGVFYYLDTFKKEGLKLTLVIILSSLVVLLVTAFAADIYEKKRGVKENGGFHK